MTRLLSSLALLSLLLVLAGCGSGGVGPNPDGSFPVLPSDQIATGNWQMESSNTSGSSYGYPIAGFWGAFTATGNRVQGMFSPLIYDPTGTGQYPACLGSPYLLAIASLHGTAKDGLMTLEGTFFTNEVHIQAQLSADHKSILSGSYSITGPCATPTTAMTGNWFPPLNGTFTGTSVSAKGKPVTLTATLSQQDRYFEAGYIPVEGTLTVASANCTTKGPLLGAYLIGPLSILGGFSRQDEGNNLLFSGEEDNNSLTITLDEWSVQNDPSCGTDYGSTNISGPIVLIKQ